jgi:single-stranded DNA-specific DHH superfamily exonuclease
VQDRDLWKFRLIGTREIQSWVFSHQYDFAVWDELAETLASDAGWRSAFDQGKALDRKMQKDIAELIEQTRREMVIGGYRVPVVNLPYTMASEAAGKLAENAPFAAAYFDHTDGTRVFSLRSRGDFDVGVLAKKVGAALGCSGGGHAAAAGFRAPLGWEGEVQATIPQEAAP